MENGSGLDIKRKYPVLQMARKISDDPELDILEVRRAMGIPLATDIRRWLVEQPPMQPLGIDFNGVRAVTLSVAEEVGPLLMQAVQQRPTLEHRYPIFILNSPEPAYTFARAFANSNWAGLAITNSLSEELPFTHTISRKVGETVVVLGQITDQTQQILALADKLAAANKSLTSEDLATLAFLSQKKVSAAARSKRLTELYARRLLAFCENPQKSKERLFVPPWRL